MEAQSEPEQQVSSLCAIHCSLVFNSLLLYVHSVSCDVHVSDACVILALSEADRLLLCCFFKSLQATAGTRKTDGAHAHFHGFVVKALQDIAFMAVSVVHHALAFSRLGRLT